MAASVNFGTQQYSGFDPRMVSGCGVWLDAADSNTVTFSTGSNVSLWKDKSGNGRNATAVVAATYSNTPSGNGLSFTGSNYYSFTDLSFAVSNYFTFFIVERLQSSSGAERTLLGTDSTGTNAAPHLRYNTTASLMRFAFYANDLDASNVIAFSSATVQPTRVWSFVFTTSFRGIYLNGVLMSNDTNNTQLTSWTTPLIGRFVSGAYYYGFMYEIIGYGGNISSRDRQVVEGYLAWKWGQALPSYNSNTPSTISNLALWLDAVDSSTIDLSGTSVSRWRDKSGNSRDASNSTSSSKPILEYNKLNGFRAIKFDGSDDRLDGSFTYPTNGQTTLFVVYEITSASGDQRVFDMGGNGYGNFGSPQSSLNAEVILWLGTNYTITQISATTGWKVYSAIYNKTTNEIWRFGQSLAISGPGATTTPTGTTYALGNNVGANSGQFSGRIAELVLYTSNLTTANRETIESYLMTKWGFNTLPLTHPFKSNPPPMRVFQPIDITGCAVWFDAADRSTITGTSITEWKSKGEITISGVTGAGTLTTGTSNINGLNVVNVPSQGTLTCSSVAIPNQPKAIFIVHRVDATQSSYISFFNVQSAAVTNYGHIQYIHAQYNNTTLYAHTTTGDTSILQASPSSNSTGTVNITGWVQSAVSTSSNAITVNGTTQTLTTSQLASTYPTASTTYYIGNAYAQAYVLGEYILFNVEFTAAQRQRIEGYLAWKWGKVSSLPSTHPFYSLPPATGLFSPPMISSNCALWFDAADTSTITGTSLVTAWVNKGSIATTMSNYTGTPTSGSNFNGLNYVTIPSGADMRFSAAIDTTARSIFYVSRVLNDFTSNTFWSLFTATVTNQMQLGVAAPSAGVYNMEFGFNAVDNFVAASITNPYNRVGIFGVVNSTTSSSNVFTDNGTSKTLSRSLNAASYVTSNVSYAVGASGYNRGGDYMEIILYYGALTPPERQVVEGYLAWKWGLQTSLPSTHPYYKFRP